MQRAAHGPPVLRDAPRAKGVPLPPGAPANLLSCHFLPGSSLTDPENASGAWGRLPSRRAS
jgi:hypothetical protein